MKQEKITLDKETRLKITRIGITAFIVIAAAMLLFFLFFKVDSLKSGFTSVMSILTPIIMGFIVAYLLNPIMKFFDELFVKFFTKAFKMKKPQKLSRTISVILSILILLIIIAALVWMIVPSIIDSVVSLASSLPAQIDKCIAWLDDFSKQNESLSGVMADILSFGKNWIEEDFMKTATSWAGVAFDSVVKTATFLGNFFISIIVAIYLLLSKETFKAQFKKLLYAFTKKKTADVSLDVIHKSNEICIGYIYGQIVSSVIIGVLCFIGVSILRIPYAVLVSVFVGVTNVIPFFGPYIGAIPTTLLILLVDPLKAFYFVIFVLLLQALEGNVIAPKILGDYTGLSPFWVIFAIIVCGGLFGVAGMIIGVPLFAVAYYLINEVVRYRLAKKNLPVETDDYKGKGIPTEIKEKTND